VTFLDPELVTDETSNAEAALAALADAMPGWSAAEHHVETIMAEVWGAALATAISVMRDDLAVAYEGLGEVLNVPRLSAAQAEASSTWVLPEPVPLQVDGGTVVTATAPDGSSVDFAVAEDTVVPGGTTVVVPLVAVEAGAVANGTSGPAFTAELPVTSIVLEPAANGTDEEGAPPYRDRLRDRARRVRLLPITPEDVAAFATDVPGVFRAYALNRYNPDAPFADSPGDVTVFPVAESGAPIGSAVRTALETYFNSQERIAGTRFLVADPGYQSLTIQVAVEIDPDADFTVVVAAVKSALLATVGPSRWDYDAEAPGLWRRRASDLFTQFHVSAAVDDLPDVLNVTDVRVNGGPAIELPGPVSLPTFTEDDVIVSVSVP
jgi:hypothetical protein